MAGPHRYCKVVMVVVVCAVASTIAMPSADGFQEHPPAIAVVASLGTFDGGFPAAFADNLPTKGFTGDFARRVRRQAGITSAIDGILSSPYSGAPFSRHLQALLQRSTNIRPARQSPPRPSSPSRPSSPFRPSSPSSFSRFPHNQGSFDRPQSQSFRPQEPRSPNTPSFSRPSSSFQPSRDSPHSPPHSEFSPPRFTPSFTRSHAIERVERPSLSQPFSSDSISGQQFASFSDIDAFFDSARVHRQRRDVAAAATRDDDRSLAHFLTHEGSSLNSVSALLNQGHRVPRHPRQHGQEQREGRREHILGQTSSHPFAVPFVVPNAFQRVGIRRRNDILETAQGRQGQQVGISATIDALLSSPYRGRMPDSLQSLFRSKDRRVVRKTPPQSHPGPSQSFTVTGSDNPSAAAVRLFPRGVRPPPPSPHFATTHPDLPHLRRTRRSAGQRGPADLHNTGPFKARPGRHRGAHQHVSEEDSLPPFGQEFGEIIVHYEYGGEDPIDEGLGKVVTLHQDEMAALLSPFVEPSRPKEGKPRPHTSSRGKPRPQTRPRAKPGPYTGPRQGKPKPYSVPGENKPRPHPRPHPFRHGPPRPPLRPHPRNPNQIPAFKPGPSPPAFILPPTSSVRAPRHVLWENQRLPMATRQQDIPLSRRMLRQHDALDHEAPRQDTSGYISGKPPNFPAFAAIGGFGPMEEVDKTNVDGTFMEKFTFPSVTFGPIDDSHPPFPKTPTFHQPPSSSSFPQQTQDVELKSSYTKVRRRRAVLEEEVYDDTYPLPASLIPHKRVHRVQTEPQDPSAPHSRQPREDLDTKSSPAEEDLDMKSSNTDDVPHYFTSVSEFEFPRLQPRNRQPSPPIRSPVTGSRFSSPVRSRSPAEFRRQDRYGPTHLTDADLLRPEGQRFYPTFNGRHITSQISPSSRPPFFPSAPIPPRVPGARAGRFLTRGFGYRESPNPSLRDQGFRDLHHKGPPVRETSTRIKPDTSLSFFPTPTRRPFHREQEHFGQDNSLLGSGNFEVLRGGTFYDLDDTNGHQHSYDHLLHDDFRLFPSVRPSSPPHSNYVDDFFSNFRDFSEFSVRRSDEGKSSLVEDEYQPDGTRGYGSEHVHRFAPSNTTIDTKNTTLTKSLKTTTRATTKTITPVPDKEIGKEEPSIAVVHQPRAHRRPNNIQEVLAEVDPHPSEYSTVSAAVEEKDPMIAMF